MFSTLSRLALLLSRPNRRIAKSLERIADLYELELASKGIHLTHQPTSDDRIEFMYGPQPPKQEDLE